MSTDSDSHNSDPQVIMSSPATVDSDSEGSIAKGVPKFQKPQLIVGKPVQEMPQGTRLTKLAEPVKLAGQSDLWKRVQKVPPKPVVSNGSKADDEGTSGMEGEGKETGKRKRQKKLNGKQQRFKHTKDPKPKDPKDHKVPKEPTLNEAVSGDMQGEAEPTTGTRRRVLQKTTPPDPVSAPRKRGKHAGDGPDLAEQAWAEEWASRHAQTLGSLPDTCLPQTARHGELSYTIRSPNGRTRVEILLKGGSFMISSIRAVPP
jgi:hypothetical protein